MSNTQRRFAAAIVITLLSLSVMSLAQAHRGEKMPAHEAIYNTTRNASTMNRESPTLDGTLHINLAWPEGSPDYHGSNGG
jgi:hypothetical protein